MEVLQKTQNIFGYIPKESIKMISSEVCVAESEVYGIITFYSQFTLTPKAKYNIDVCLGTACFVLGANDILEKILAKLKVKVGQMTEDGKWIVNPCSDAVVEYWSENLVGGSIYYKKTGECP